LLPGADERTVLRYIRVCHDACHAAVMFEDQEEAMERYRSAGVEVGKVQVSSAVCAPLDRLAEDQRAAALQQLASFAEDRYLHQTLVRKEANAELQFYDDLPAALEHHRGRETHAGQWRVHFHVPIYLERFGLLETSQPQIKDCLQTAIRSPGLIHFEVETYAWSVLPNGLQQPDLAAGVARELHWLAEAFQSLGVDRDP
jgi:hypothetical protein